MKRLLIITIVLAAWHFATQAQKLNIWKYTIEDGLVNNDVLNIYQDGQGFIWLCTRGGLSHYDGSRFTNYTTDNGLTHDMINDIYEIAPGEFIVAQNMNGPRLLKNGQLAPLKPISKLILNRFYSINNKRLLATTDYNGIVEWNKGEFRPVNPAYTKTVAGMAIVKDSLWLLYEEVDSAQLTTPSLKPWSSETYLGLTSVFTDSRFRTWIATSRELKLLDPHTLPGQPIQTLALPRFIDLPFLKNTRINAIIEDSRGNYWIGTSNGLIKIDKDGTSHIYTQNDGLPSPAINCIKEDRHHNIWIGTVNGLAKFSLNQTINTIAGKYSYPYTNNVTIAPITDTSVWFFDGNTIRKLNLSTGLAKNMVSVAGYGVYKTDKNELLITSSRKGQIYQYWNEGTETIEWPDKSFEAVIRVNEKDFIGAEGNRLYVISKGRYIEKLTIPSVGKVEYLASGKRGMLWAGTRENGLVKISIEQSGDSLQLKITDTLEGRLPDRHIRAAFADKENEIWIGTRYKGVIRVLELPDGKYELQHYGTREGLSSDFVFKAIIRDTAGNIWVGSAQGLDKLIPEGNKYRVFKIGRLNKFFYRVTDIHLLRNKYLLATSYPSLSFVQDLQQDTLPSLPVYLTRISTGPDDTSSLLYVNEARLSYNKAQIYFEFSSPQYLNEDFTQYSYRLLGGHDTSWNSVGKSRSVYFANLRPGSYTFETRALGFNGQWGRPASYSFIVSTPFWQKSWFILLVIIAASLLIYALYRYRMQQLIRLHKVRNRIATDLHDEIGSNLTNISILSSLSKKSLSQPEKAGNFLQRISEEVASSSQALDDIIWSVNSNHDTLEETVTRMRRYAAELFDAANISNELYLDPAFEEKKLSMEQRRDIYLLYKEAVNNISKHAEAKQVSIQLAIVHNQLVLEIKDDGKGFLPGKISDRHGLNGMTERVKKWKGKIEIESAVQKGTTIHIRLPLSG
ncbi:MAG TPA: two-component regulator propeller domain-containing protein [Chitinophagaceae bacterium]